MKFLILAAAFFPLSSFALSVSNPELVRVLDGNVVNCRETFEVGKTTYNPVLNDLKIEGRALEARFGINFVSCFSREEKLGLEPSLPLAPSERRDESGELVRIEYRDPGFLVGDANFSSAVSIPLENKISQEISARVELDRVLTPEQRRQLAGGKPVRARLSLMARRVGTLVTRGERIALGWRFLGSFTFFVTISP